MVNSEGAPGFVQPGGKTCRNHAAGNVDGPDHKMPWFGPGDRPDHRSADDGPRDIEQLQGQLTIVRSIRRIQFRFQCRPNPPSADLMKFRQLYDWKLQPLCSLSHQARQHSAGGAKMKDAAAAQAFGVECTYR